jgi:Tfp pilus assembly protein PilN
MINLLPPEIKDSIRFARINVILIQYAIIAIFTVVIVITLMLFGKASLGNTKSELEELIRVDRVKIAELEQVNTEAKKLSETVSTIGKLIDQEVKFSVLLQEIGAVIPKGTVVSGLTLSQDAAEPISLSVLTDSAERAGVLQENLIASDLFLSADILSVTKASGDVAGGYQFTAELQAYYNPDLPLATLDDPVTEGGDQP